MDGAVQKRLFRKMRSHLHLSRGAQSLAKAVTFAGVLLLVGTVDAGSDQDDAQRVIDGAFVRIVSGATLTAQIDRDDPQETSTTLERTYVSGSNFRVDSILDYQPGQPLTNPQVFVELRTAKPRISSFVTLEGDFKNSEEVFAKMLAHPSPELRKSQGAPAPVGAHTAQVLGFDGTNWMSDELKKWGDGAVASEGPARIVTYGHKAELMRRIIIDPRNPLLEGYSLTANAGSTTVVTSIKIARDPASKVNEAVYTVEGTARTTPPGDIHYRLKFVQEKFGPVDPSVFTYDNGKNSLEVNQRAK